LRDSEDAYGHLMYDYFRGRHGAEIVEREDGLFDVSNSLPGYYMSDYSTWKVSEKLGLRYVRGRVIDVGCGAGRISLFLQQKGLDVLAVDVSPLAVRVCKLRGVRKVMVISATGITSVLGVFDTIVMFGNNFGLFGNPQRAKWLLKRFHNMTSEKARIIVESFDPYKTTDPVHRQYHAINRRKGRLGGQLKIRVRYRKYVTPWFQYLIVSKSEMRKILKGTGWTLRRTFETKSGSYVAIIEKTKV